MFGTAKWRGKVQRAPDRAAGHVQRITRGDLLAAVVLDDFDVVEYVGHRHPVGRPVVKGRQDSLTRSFHRLLSVVYISILRMPIRSAMKESSSVRSP